MSTTAPHIERARKQHHFALERLVYNLSGKLVNGLQTWRKLRRIERQAHRAAEALCNGDIDQDSFDSVERCVHGSIGNIFGKVPPGFFVNGDPRGYALKLEPGSVPFPLHEDWGRYQILAPEIN